MLSRRYTIDPRPAALGGGWRLRLLEGDIEVGGGVFPPAEGLDLEAASSEAHADALAEGESWVAEYDSPAPSSEGLR